MPFQPVILWTDALIYLLLGVVIAFIIVTRRKEHLRAPWREVARSKMAMSCLVILLAYFAVGLLDSLHFRHALSGPAASNGRVDYSTEVLSVFDVLAAPLRTRTEKTYSAPFATQLYTKETITHPDGTQVREFPRLKFGGAHLKDPAPERGMDILYRSLKAVVWGGGCWLLVSLLWITVLAWRAKTSFRLMFNDVTRGQTHVPWR
ncbi:MAG: ABC transporter permease, partial [Gammaproteobacteria bacterium]